MVAVSWEWGCVKWGLTHPPTGHTAHRIPTIPSWHKLDSSAARNSDSGFREPRVASRRKSSPRLESCLDTGQERHEETWCPSPVWHTLQASYDGRVGVAPGTMKSPESGKNIH